MKGDAGRDDRARRGSTPKAEDTRRRILAAALDLFQERGFAETTREIREQSIEHFREALEGSGARIPADLAPHLPLLLWLYQMGVILFWIHDRSPRQTRTQRLLDHSLDLIVRAIQVSRFPLLTPIRKAALRLVTVVTDPTLPEEAR